MKSRLTFLLLFVIFAITVSAQTFRGGIQGTVTDNSGAVVPEAQLTVTSIATGFTRTTTADSSGNFSFAELPLGEYNLTATKTGFRTQTQKGVQVTVSQAQRADVQMTVGSVSEAVEVVAEVPIIETSGNTLGGNIDAKQFAELPVNGRDFTKMLTLVPGANADPSSVNDAPGSFGIFTINGNR